MKDLILRIHNQHSENCGKPPLITNDGNQYIGYFVNEHGEQWVFVYDYETDQAVVFGGDAGWDQRYDVSDGMAFKLVMNKFEQQWLAACWKAATVLRRKS
jgi:hypothetical protein